MNKRVSLILLIIPLFIGCHKDNGPSSPSNESGIVISLSGQISSWNHGTHRMILLIGPYNSQATYKVCASSRIDNTGHFSLQNLTPPSLSQQGSIVYPTISPGYTYSQNTVVCSDSSARIYYGQLIVTSDTSSTMLGYVGRQSYEGTVVSEEYFTVYYFYSIADVNLTGLEIDTLYNASSSYEFRETRHFDVTFTKGWNQQVLHSLARIITHDSTKTIQATESFYTNTEPYGDKWVYYGL